uniref:Uncharacterized protein n=1 Tax=Coptotermes formosanus TaxID=36987 RepID=R4UL39_COPFO|nr:hypothetical protein [Coptotermes formosanus]
MIVNDDLLSSPSLPSGSPPKKETIPVRELDFSNYGQNKITRDAAVGDSRIPQISVARVDCFTIVPPKNSRQLPSTSNSYRRPLVRHRDLETESSEFDGPPIKLSTPSFNSPTREVFVDNPFERDDDDLRSNKSYTASRQSRRTSSQFEREKKSDGNPRSMKLEKFPFSNSRSVKTEKVPHSPSRSVKSEMGSRSVVTRELLLSKYIAPDFPQKLKSLRAREYRKVVYQLFHNVVHEDILHELIDVFSKKHEFSK